MIEQAIQRIPTERYPELPIVLNKFVTGVQSALGNNFVGAYLVGSLATGDFDLDSDVDFLVVTEEEPADAEVGLLRALHLEMHNLGNYPARHLEGSYIPKNGLTRADLVGTEPFWFIDNGSTQLERSTHDNRWHVRRVLRECAITRAGPDPKTLLEPVPAELLRNEMVTAIEKLKALFFDEIGQPLGWFNTRFGQSFAVLTCCRMLHTLQSGAVKSKLAAVQWAEQSLDAEWHGLIRQAWAERKDVRFGLKVRELSDAGLLRETARFLAYAQNELRRRP